MSASATKRPVDEEEEFEEEEDDHNVKKKKVSETKTVVSKAPSGSGGGSGVFELGGNRKVTVAPYKNNLYINIREFYEDKSTGELKPGNKGIALSVEQWNSLCDQVEDINRSIIQQRGRK
jgi:hypothetical protein